MQNVKSPSDGLTELNQNADGKWMRDPQLIDLVSNALHAMPSLAYMDVPPAQSVIAGRIVSVVWNLLAHRSWSLAARHHGPPQSYIGLLSSRHLRQRSAMQLVEQEWKALALLEQRRLTWAPAKRLWDDLQYARLRPLRLFWALCESCNYNYEACGSAKSLLRGMLEVWPDNKIVEDCHNVVKADTLKTRCSKRNSERQSDVMVHSGILETRNVKHTSRVTKQAWLSRGGPLHQRRATTNSSIGDRQRHRHYSQRHRLPKRWSELMGKKVWGTCTEANHRKCLAAWHWYQVGRPSSTVPGGQPPKLADALLTRLLSCEMVIQRGDLLFASLGSYSWGALVYPLHVLQADTDGLRTLRWGGDDSAVMFVHVLDVAEWSVLSWTSALAPAQGIVLQEIAPPQTLLEYSLRETCASMSADLLQQVAGCIGVPVQTDRSQLLRGIAGEVFKDCPDREHIVTDILKRDKSAPKQNAAATLLLDPLFEAAWDEMGQDDQIEFPDVRKEKTRGRVRRHVARHQESARERKKQRIRGPIGRGAPPAAEEVADEEDPALAPAQGNIHEQDIVPAPPPPLWVPREPRGIPWGRSGDGRPMFVLAKTPKNGSLYAITVTCNLHVHRGKRCNKSLTLGACFSEEEALWRIKAWCVAGLGLPDGDHARQRHMDPAFFNPRTVATGELQSLEEMSTLVNA